MLIDNTALMKVAAYWL